MAGQWKNQETRAVAIWLGVNNLGNEVVVALGQEVINEEKRAPKVGADKLPWARHKWRRDMLSRALQSYALRGLGGGVSHEVQGVLIECSLMQVDYLALAEVLLDKLIETEEVGQCVSGERSIGYTSAGPGEAD